MQRANSIQPLQFVCKAITEPHVILSFALPCAETNRVPVFQSAIAVLFCPASSALRMCCIRYYVSFTFPILFFGVFV